MEKANKNHYIKTKCIFFHGVPALMVETLLVPTVILLLSLGYHGGLWLVVSYKLSYIAYIHNATFSLDYTVYAEGVKIGLLGRLI